MTTATATATATTQSTLLAVYADHNAAEAAVKLLQKEGLPMQKLSIVGQDFTTIEKPLGFVTTSSVASDGARVVLGRVDSLDCLSERRS